MKFEHKGKTYKLEFFRKFENVEIIRKKKVTGDGKTEVIRERTTKRSKYPFTTARILELRSAPQTPITVISDKVGCLPSDKFSNESGRVAALRAVTAKLYKSLPKDEAKQIARKMWEAYGNRGRTEKASTPSTPIPLPASSLNTVH